LVRGLGIVAAAWLACASGALAQDTDTTSLQAKKQALFQQMLRDPANLDVAFAYADVAAQLGDNEAAVAALERMLLFNPNLPRVDLELGALYFRMGSFEAAESYFDKAKSFNPPPEVMARIDDYLAQIHKSEQPNQFTGFFMMGAQYQTDANVAPGSPLISSPIGDVLLSNQFVKHDDANFFATGSVLYSYDLGDQDRDTIETVATGFANHYLQFKRLDIDLGEVTVGPRLRYPSAPFVTDLTFKPYAIVNEVGLGENQYFWTYGAGLEFTGVLPGEVAAKISWEFREKNFSDAPDRPLSRGLNGNDNVLSLVLTKPITPNQAVSFEFDYLDQATRLTYYANMDYAFSGGYRIRYDDPTGLLKLPWETVGFLSRSYAVYQSPDPCCVTGYDGFGPTFSDRFDRHWRFGVTQTFQVAQNMAVVLQLQRDIVSSNLPLYGYTSDSVLIGPQIRF